MDEKLILTSYISEEDKQHSDQYSPLVLAYIGDAVFEIFVREMLVRRANTQVNKLHKMASSIVKAESQAKMIEAIKQELNEKEMSIYRRGRNAKSHTVAKHAKVSDYRKATGFEALMGYLYLNDEQQRMTELMEKAVRSELENERKID